MKHDYKQMELSDSVCDYIEEIAYMIPINTDIVLEIHCPEIDEEMQNKIRKNIKNNYGMEIDDNEYDLAINNRRACWFAIAGVALLMVHILIESYGRLFADFLSVVWWVAIWDMVEILVLGNQDIKWKRLNNQQLYDSTVRFVFEDKVAESDDIFSVGGVVKEKVVSSVGRNLFRSKVFKLFKLAVGDVL